MHVCTICISVHVWAFGFVLSWPLCTFKQTNVLVSAYPSKQNTWWEVTITKVIKLTGVSANLLHSALSITLDFGRTEFGGKRLDCKYLSWLNIFIFIHVKDYNVATTRWGVGALMFTRTVARGSLMHVPLHLMSSLWMMRRISSVNWQLVLEGAIWIIIM